MDIEPRLLRYFIAVAEEKSFTAAAKKLYISQPPLSLAIRQLEEKLATRLFTRTQRKVEITPAGYALLREGKRWLAHGQTLQNTIAQVHSNHLQPIRIGFVSSMLYRDLPQIVQTLHNEIEGIQPMLMEMNSKEQIDALSVGHIDMGCIHANPLHPDISGIDMDAEPLFLCVHQSHPFLSQPMRDFTTLANEPFILFSPSVSPHYYQLVLALCQQLGFYPNIQHEIRQWLTATALIERGLGISMVPAALTNPAHPVLHFIPIEGSAHTVNQLIFRTAEKDPKIVEVIHAIRHFLDAKRRL